MNKEQEKTFMQRYPDLVKYLVINDLYTSLIKRWERASSRYTSDLVNANERILTNNKEKNTAE